MLAPYEAAGDWQGALQLLRERNAARADQLLPNDWMRLGRSLQVIVLTKTTG
jgi:tRNA A37 N6-isopentenylltransferase MiaA